MSLETKLRSFEKRIPSLMERVLVQMDKSFEKAFDSATIEPNKSIFNDSKKIRSSGTLRDSFIEQKEAKFKRLEVQVKYQSNLKYAKVQEEGAFIKSKGRMHKFFWAKFFETKIDKYKFIALGVLKNKGVNIPARPYLKKTKETFDKILNSNEFRTAFAQEVAREWLNA